MRRLRLKALLSALAPAALGALALTAPLGAQAQSAQSLDCPAFPDNVLGRPTSNLVEADVFDNGGGKFTYTLKSVNESPTNGVPGVIEYCVYSGDDTPVGPPPAPWTPVLPPTWTVDSGIAAIWADTSGGGYFGFGRVDGNPTNIPSDGITRTIGTAQFSVTPASPQFILLHINDFDECQALYPGSIDDTTGELSSTCFVIPGTVPSEENNPATSDITTEIHLGATDNGTPIIVNGSNSCNVLAGSFVHDSADCTTTPPTAAPSGSTITFYFFANDTTCTSAPVATSLPIDVSGQTDPFIDPALAQGPLTPGAYSYQAVFTSGDTSKLTGSTSDCEPFTVFAAPLTAGYWKTHLAPLGTIDPLFGANGCVSNQGCSANGPWTQPLLPKLLGNYSVDTLTKVVQVYNAMNCSNASTNSQNAVGCLSGQLLTTELNIANGSDTCINATVILASNFLKSISYNGPTASYSLSAAQRSTAVNLKTLLDTYNNGGGCNNFCK